MPLVTPSIAETFAFLGLNIVISGDHPGIGGVYNEDGKFLYLVQLV